MIDGSLVSLPKPGETTGDIVTVDEFDNFDLTWDWKMAPGGNSGIQYRVTEQSKNPWDSGPEYQMIDKKLHEDGNNPLSSAGSLLRSLPAIEGYGPTGWPMESITVGCQRQPHRTLVEW